MSVRQRGDGTVVLGAGLAGLAAAHYGGPGVRVFEALPRLGGKCATDQVRGFAFDQAGHLLHVRTPRVRELIQRLLPGKLRLVTRDARIHLAGREVRYPFQANLFGLPPEIKAEALRDYLEAALAPQKKPRHFADWAQRTFGATMARLFFEPYNRKLWTVLPEELTLDWMRDYVPRPALGRVIRGAFQDVPQGGGYNETFWYPAKGGIDQLAVALAGRGKHITLNASAREIDLRRRTVEISGHGSVPWRRLISTLPLPVLAARCRSLPKGVREAASHLRANSVMVVNLGIRGPRLHSAHWIYFPEDKFSFYRVGFPSNFGRVAPAGCSSLYAEVAVPAGTGWDQRKTIAGRVRRDLRLAGILTARDRVVVEHLQYLPYAYVIYDQAYQSARKHVLEYLERQGVASIGRWGHWEYSAMEGALLAGKTAGQTCK